jgi:hypothetical protein
MKELTAEIARAKADRQSRDMEENATWQDRLNRPKH